MRFVTQEQADNEIAAAIESREREIANYDLNAANYRAMLAMYSELPDEWPDSISHFKGIRPHLVAPKTSDEVFALFSKYEHRDQLRLLARTNKAEREKSQAVLNALEENIPSDRLDAAVARIKQQQQVD